MPLEYLSITRLVTGQFGGTGEAALNTLDQAFLTVLLVYGTWYPLALLLPACSVLSRENLIAAYLRQTAWTQSTDGREMLMFLPVTVVAVAMFFASPRALLESLTATEIPGILAFIIRSMTLQLAVALLFAATIPWWKREHERARQAA